MNRGSKQYVSMDGWRTLGVVPLSRSGWSKGDLTRRRCSGQGACEVEGSGDRGILGVVDCPHFVCHDLLREGTEGKGKDGNQSTDRAKQPKRHFVS